MKHFARYSVFPPYFQHLSLDAWLPLYLHCILQQLGLSRAGGGHHIYCYSLFVKQQRLVLHRGPCIFID